MKDGNEYIIFKNWISVILEDAKNGKNVNINNLLSAHKECHFFRVYFDCEGDLQYSFSSIFNRSNTSF
jgi:hypothetical protein